MALSQEIECLKKSLDSYRCDLKTVSDTNDNILGSIACIASEYGDFLDKMSETAQLSQEISNVRSSIEHIAAKQEMTKIQLERLEQYGRRENLELHGIPPSQNENTNEIVKRMASLLNVKIDNSQISISNRLQVPVSKRQESSAHPLIIVRFSIRDKRNELFVKRRMLKNNPTNFSSAFGFQYISQSWMSRDVSRSRDTFLSVSVSLCQYLVSVSDLQSLGKWSCLNRDMKKSWL